jgi:hypothetical protein
MTDQLDRLKAALADRYAIERELGRGEDPPFTGSTPVPIDLETALAFDFLVCDADTERWEFLARGQDVTQFLFAEPLSDEQMEKLRR